MSYIIQIQTKKHGWWWNRKYTNKYVVGWNEDTYFGDCGYVCLGGFTIVQEFDTLREADEMLKEILQIDKLNKERYK